MQPIQVLSLILVLVSINVTLCVSNYETRRQVLALETIAAELHPPLQTHADVGAALEQQLSEALTNHQPKGKTK